MNEINWRRLKFNMCAMSRCLHISCLWLCIVVSSRENTFYTVRYLCTYFIYNICSRYLRHRSNCDKRRNCFDFSFLSGCRFKVFYEQAIFIITIIYYHSMVGPVHSAGAHKISNNCLHCKKKNTSMPEQINCSEIIEWPRQPAASCRLLTLIIRSV